MSLVGEIDLAIAIVHNSCAVLRFIIKSTKNSKQFGNNLRQIQTQMIAEVARLEALTGFLNQRNSSNEPQLARFPVLHRRAIIGLIQELDILFSAYQIHIDKYNLSELREFEYELSTEDEIAILENSDNVPNPGIAESETRQQRASFPQVAAWGFFRKKNIEKIIAAVTSWNDRLMNLMICGLCFGKDPFPLNIEQLPERATLENLRCRTGLIIRKLVLDDSTTDSNILQPNWRLQAPTSLEKSSIQQLVKTNEAGSITTELVYVEYKPFDLRRGATKPSSSVMQRMCRLATLLRQPKAAENGFRTLRCSGVVQENYPEKRFAFVFELPSPSQIPVSLSEAISLHNSKRLVRPTLNEKFQIASAIAETVFQFHSVHWLHKSIRSEHVLFFYDGNSHLGFCKPHLVGFEFSRDENDRSTTEKDDSLACNIYRHPDRWGPPEERFGVLHDIYALGVVLLEIGIWRPVLGFDKRFDEMDSDEVRKCLELNAKERLPHYMGVEYTRAVLACLGGELVKKEQAAEKSVGSGDQSKPEEMQIAFWENVVESVRGLV